MAGLRQVDLLDMPPRRLAIIRARDAYLYWLTAPCTTPSAASRRHS